MAHATGLNGWRWWVYVSDGWMELDSVFLRAHVKWSCRAKLTLTLAIFDFTYYKLRNGNQPRYLHVPYHSF